MALPTSGLETRPKLAAAWDRRRSTAPSGRRAPLPAWRSIPSGTASAPPCSFGLSLPEPWPITSCSAVIRSEASSPYFLQMAISSGEAANSSSAPNPVASAQRARAAREQEALAAVLLADFVFVGQVVADRVDVKIAGLDHRFHGLGQRRLHALLLVLRQPTARGLRNTARWPPASPSDWFSFWSVMVTKLCDVPLAARASR